MENIVVAEASSILEEIEADLMGMVSLTPDVRSRIYSFSVMGGPIKGRPVESVIDLDVFGVSADVLTNAEFRSLQNYLREFEKLGTKNVDVSYQIVFGPVKNSSSKPCSIILHFMIFDRTAYANLPVPLLKYSLQNEAYGLFGQDLGSVAPIEKITMTEVLDSPQGIRFFVNVLREKKLVAMTVEEGPGNVASVVPKEVGVEWPFGMLELSCYCVLRAASNATRAARSTPHVGIGSDAMQQFAEEFDDFALKEYPKEAIVMKSQLRNPASRPGQVEAEEICQGIVDSALGFLELLDEYLVRTRSETA